MDRTLRHWLSRLALAPAIVAISVALASPASAQVADRYVVLVPAFTNAADPKAKFGKDVAKDIIKLLEDFASHQPADAKVLRDAFRKYSIKEDDLGTNGCLTARQLALQINVNLVMCGTFEGAPGNYTAKVSIIAPAESEVYDLKPFQAADAKTAAQAVASEFEGWIEGLKVLSYCSQYVESQNWQSAIENCTKAVDAAPSKGSLYLLSYAQWQSGDRENAYGGFKRVLELEALHQESMKALGILATEMGRAEEGMQYFREYVNLNPGDRAVRLAVATDAAKANQFEAALKIVEDGLTGEDANNIDLLQAAGVFAMNAANQKVGAAGGTVTPDAKTLFEKALIHLDKVYEIRGAQMDVALVRNIVQANRLIERNDAAIGFAEKATKEAAFASDAGLWSAFADALNKAGRQDEAFAALDKAQSIDANYAVNARRASWKLDAGDVAGAEPAIRAGVQKGEITAQQADALAQKIAVTAFQKKGQTGQHQAALRDYAVAEEFASSPLGKAYIAFFKGYSVLQIAVEREKPENLATAQATLPMFKEVLALMSAAAGVPANLQANRQEMIDAANQYVAIQEAIIKRGR